MWCEHSHQLTDKSTDVWQANTGGGLASTPCGAGHFLLLLSVQRWQPISPLTKCRSSYALATVKRSVTSVIPWHFSSSPLYPCPSSWPSTLSSSCGVRVSSMPQGPSCATRPRPAQTSICTPVSLLLWVSHGLLASLQDMLIV